MENPRSPIIYNVTITDANTEYSQLLPTGTKKLTVKLRGTSALLKIAFENTKSGTTYITVPYGSSFNADDIDMNGITIYVQSPTAAQTCEILAWTG